MIDFKNIENIFFVGAGGIGMSALVRYFLAGEFKVGGYDRVETDLTRALSAEGCTIQYTDELEKLEEDFLNIEKTLIIYTPAVSAKNALLKFFSGSGHRIFKRAEILGLISKNSNTLAIAGTHGKTSVSTLTAHLIKQSAVDCTAFLGGISKNYMSNLLIGEGDITVIEADEFDRSFHQLTPYIAAITSMDADHLDIYGNHENMIEAYNHFASLIKEGGSLVVNSKIRGKIKNLPGISIFTYGMDEDSDFRIDKLKQENGAYSFNLITPFNEITDLVSLSPGKLSLENSILAIALASLAGVSESEVRRALIHFKGVERRFDIRMDKGGITYIDDYAHHPQELDYFIKSVRQFYGDRKITIVFQPHLYTRTKDHAQAFARSLDVAERVVLLPIYAAREEPLQGITSKTIFDLMQCRDKVLLEKDELLDYLGGLEIDLMLTVGAGDIDTMAGPVEDFLKKKTG